MADTPVVKPIGSHTQLWLPLYPSAREALALLKASQRPTPPAPPEPEKEPRP